MSKSGKDTNEQIAEAVTGGFQKIEHGVVGAYQKIEDGVVGTYQKIESGVVGAYQKVEDAFVGKFLTHEGESVEDAKKRLAEEQSQREQAAEKRIDMADAEANKNVGKQ